MIRASENTTHFMPRNSEQTWAAFDDTLLTAHNSRS
jgi:hypothetical protein